ncbi:hypothetical protein BaRGS_00021012 [Batillaria attramentaria]|uniref:Uncharacterized protein n=1 Tax=Batillaria attramentaria TaxID=370345 RepID=A0ABD0KL84_9CAEN
MEKKNRGHAHHSLRKSHTFSADITILWRCCPARQHQSGCYMTPKRDQNATAKQSHQHWLMAQHTRQHLARHINFREISAHQSRLNNQFQQTSPFEISRCRSAQNTTANKSHRHWLMAQTNLTPKSGTAT